MEVVVGPSSRVLFWLKSLYLYKNKVELVHCGIVVPSHFLDLSGSVFVLALKCS